jgi:integrase
MKTVKPLTELQIKKAKPKEKMYKIYDGEGLILRINPSGKKTWLYDYRLNNKRNTYTIGEYPLIPLKEARDKKDELKKLVSQGLNPKLANKHKIYTFKEISDEYFELKKNELSQKHIEKLYSSLKANIFPFIGNMDINTIDSALIFSILKKVQDRGAISYANKIFSLVERIYRYANTTGKANKNILAGIDKSLVLKKLKEQNFKHTTDPKELKNILLSIDEYFGDISTKRALQILPYLFVRPFNIRAMQWDEIDFDKKLWIIPAKKMKMKKEHIVPLYKTVIEILKQQKEFSYSLSSYVFPSIISKTRIMSENTLNVALKRLGFNITSHGFRHTASTLLHENMHIHNIPSEVIETQLAHTVGNSVHQIYNKALYIDLRVKLMNWWGEYLDNLKIS